MAGRGQLNDLSQIPYPRLSYSRRHPEEFRPKYPGGCSMNHEANFRVGTKMGQVRIPVSNIPPGPILGEPVIGQCIAVLRRTAVYFAERYLVMETGVRRFTDENGIEVQLTDERFRHILRRHPEMAFQLHRFAETLASPDAVSPSRSSPAVQLYYRLYPDLRGRNRYICLVVKRETGYSFILTAYLDRRIKGELP